MSNPLLKVNALPNLYKHCRKVEMLHIDLYNEGVNEDSDYVEAYLNYCREQMYNAIEANFVTSQASRVRSHDETFVVFKSNTEKRILHDFIKALFAELDMYCDQKVKCAFQFCNATIFQIGGPVKLFHNVDVNDEIQKSNVYEQSTVTYQHDKKPRGKQFLSLQEYKPQYERLSKRKQALDSKAGKNIDPVIETTKEESVKEEGSCEYYI